MGICFSQLKEQERWVIEKLLYENCSITYIAKVINKDKSTVSREIKRGTITILNSNLQEKEIYDAKAGQRVYEENRKKGYNEPKYKDDTDLMKSIESKILYDKSSPRETSYYLSDTKNITVSYSTIYRYIEKKYFDNFVRQMRLIKGNCLPMGAGACTRCRKCTYPDRPCRHPDRLYPSMEAYGLWVSDVCTRSGLGYNYGPQTITYTSCILYDQEQ